MTRIRLSHQFADSSIIDTNLTGFEGEPDCVDLTIDVEGQEMEVSLTKADIKAMYVALRIDKNKQ